VAIARRRPNPIAAIAAPVPPAPVIRPPAPELGVPASIGDAPATDAVAPIGRLRRCTFRRIDGSALPGRAIDNSYAVMCLYDADAPMALGDISSATPVCRACTASGIFRPDED
jgi:hypothetical protein